MSQGKEIIFTQYILLWSVERQGSHGLWSRHQVSRSCKSAKSVKYCVWSKLFYSTDQKVLHIHLQPNSDFAILSVNLQCFSFNFKAATLQRITTSWFLRKENSITQNKYNSYHLLQSYEVINIVSHSLSDLHFKELEKCNALKTHFCPCKQK